RCRVLMTSTFESYAMGHTIVLSRGLLDVLPDEATLAALLAHELGHIVLGHRMDTQFAFFDRLRFDERYAFRRFALSRPSEEELAANRKGSDLLMKSPYRDQLATAQLFLRALKSRLQEITNLISPHLADSMPTNWTLAPARPSTPAACGKPRRCDCNHIVRPLSPRLPHKSRSFQWSVALSQIQVGSAGVRILKEALPKHSVLTLPHPPNGRYAGAKTW